MRKTIAKAATAGAAGVAAAGLLTAPAMASGPFDELFVDLKNSQGTIVGQVHINLVDAPHHYDIAIADKAPGDGKIPCVRIYAKDNNKPVYCDDNGTSAARHVQVYYNWKDADFILR